MKQNKDFIRVGITGGTGSGKTVFSKFLREMGYRVIDADEISRDAFKSPEVISYLKESFGEALLTENLPDRKKTAEKVFTSQVLLKKYLSVIMPIIVRNIRNEYRSEKAKGSEIIFLDAPLLFETEKEDLYDVSVLIDVPEDIQIKRAMERDKITEEEVRARMRNQMSREDKLKKADIVIENNGSLSDLKEKAEEVIERIRFIYARKKRETGKSS